MKELYRRLVFLAGFLGGLFLITWSPPLLFRASPIDWNKEYASKHRPAQTVNQDSKKLTEDDSAPTLQQYIDEKTESRLITVRGAQWEGFFNEIASTFLGNPSSPDWRMRQSQTDYGHSLYFTRTDEPLSEISQNFDHDRSFNYVRIQGEKRSEYLAVTLSTRDSFIRFAPGFLAFPHRFAGLCLIIIVLLVYSLVPWPKQPEEGLYYSHFSAGLLPDLVAAFMGGIFFVIPIFVISHNSAGAGLFSEGWGFLTGTLWALAILSFSIFFFSAQTMAIRLEIRGDAFTLFSLKGQDTHSLSEVDRVEPTVKREPKALSLITSIVSAFNWRVLSQSLMFQHEDFGFELVLKNGERYPVSLSALNGAEPFLGQLQKAGAKINPEVLESLDLEPGNAVFPAQFPKPKKNLAPYFALLPILPLVLASFHMTKPKEPLIIKPASFTPKAFELPKEGEPSVTWETYSKENAIIREIKKEQKRMNELAEKIKTAKPEDRPSLTAEFEKSRLRINELQKEFDGLGTQPEKSSSTASSTNTSGKNP